ncbi:hypothetical protein HK104_007974, partial [Borealophlyctis nickersoniae]
YEQQTESQTKTTLQTLTTLTTHLTTTPAPATVIRTIEPYTPGTTFRITSEHFNTETGEYTVTLRTLRRGASIAVSLPKRRYGAYTFTASDTNSVKVTTVEGAETAVFEGVVCVEECMVIVIVVEIVGEVWVKFLPGATETRTQTETTEEVVMDTSTPPSTWPASGHAYTETGKSAYEYLQTLTSTTSTTEWTKHSSDEGVEMCVAETEDESVLVKTETRFEEGWKVADVVTFLGSVESRRMWDVGFKRCEVVERINTWEYIFRWIYEQQLDETHNSYDVLGIHAQIHDPTTQTVYLL